MNIDEAAETGWNFYGFVSCIQNIYFLTTTITISLIFFAVYKTRELPSIHVVALNSTNNFNTIYINLKLKNRNTATALYYDDPLYFNLSFIPKEQNMTIHLAEFGLHGFYQGRGNAKRVKGMLTTHGLSSVTNATAGSFRVDFLGKVRHKLVGYHMRHRMLLAANVQVDDKTGVRVGEKGIRLVDSGASDHKRAMILCVFMLFGVSFV